MGNWYAAIGQLGLAELDRADVVAAAGHQRVVVQDEAAGAVVGRAEVLQAGEAHGVRLKARVLLQVPDLDDLSGNHRQKAAICIGFLRGLKEGFGFDVTVIKEYQGSIP